MLMRKLAPHFPPCWHDYYTTKVFIKITIYKSGDQHVTKLTDNYFNKLHCSFCCNFPKTYLLCWHYACTYQSFAPPTPMWGNKRRFDLHQH